MPATPRMASRSAQRLAFRPAAQGRKLAPAPGPAPVPQAPLRALQTANRRFGQARVGRARAEASGGLQGVFNTHGAAPPTEDNQPPPAALRAAAATAQRRRRTAQSRACP